MDHNEIIIIIVLIVVVIIVGFAIKPMNDYLLANQAGQPTDPSIPGYANGIIVIIIVFIGIIILIAVVIIL